MQVEHGIVFRGVGGYRRHDHVAAIAGVARDSEIPVGIGSLFWWLRKRTAGSQKNESEKSFEHKMARAVPQALYII
jgi:hypothetical protein